MCPALTKEDVSKAAHTFAAAAPRSAARRQSLSAGLAATHQCGTPSALASVWSTFAAPSAEAPQVGHSRARSPIHRSRHASWKQWRQGSRCTASRTAGTLPHSAHASAVPSTCSTCDTPMSGPGCVSAVPGRLSACGCARASATAAASSIAGCVLLFAGSSRPFWDPPRLAAREPTCGVPAREPGPPDPPDPPELFPALTRPAGLLGGGRTARRPVDDGVRGGAAPGVLGAAGGEVSAAASWLASEGAPFGLVAAEEVRDGRLGDPRAPSVAGLLTRCGGPGKAGAVGECTGGVCAWPSAGLSCSRMQQGGGGGQPQHGKRLRRRRSARRGGANEGEEKKGAPLVGWARSPPRPGLPEARSAAAASPA